MSKATRQLSSLNFLTDMDNLQLKQAAQLKCKINYWRAFVMTSDKVSMTDVALKNIAVQIKILIQKIL